MNLLIVDNPYTLEPAFEVPLSSGAEVDAFLDRAQKAAQKAHSLPLAERIAICQRALAAMKAQTGPTAEAISQMMGKPRSYAEKEMDGLAQRAQAMIELAEASLADVEILGKPGFVRRIRRVPLGVVFCLPAWNYPLVTAVNVVFPAVLAGNAVVLKHSPRSPRCGEAFAEAFAKAGGPEDLVIALQCSHPESERIAGDHRINYVAFTGSGYGGRRIYSAAANHRFIEVGLELGGNDAAYVAPDADLARAIDGIVDGACFNSGQSCCAVERAYVHRSHYDAFLEGAKALMEAYRLGDPMDPSTNMGPMAQPDAPGRIESQVASAVSAGARVLCGGKAVQHNGKGRFFAPTLVVDAPASCDLLRQETFGPVLPVIPVDSEAEAIAMINDSDLGLTASIWTQDIAIAERVAPQLEVGTVFMNQCDTLDPALPWTGTKDSGKGSTLSALGFQHLTRPQAINFKR